MTDETDMGPLQALADGGMQAAELEGRPVLLLRHGETVTVLPGKCPHAGGPLAEGVLHNGRIICPWHKATFCARTGDLLEPPAVDRLAPYKVRVRDGRVLVAQPDAPVQAASTPDDRCFVIIGGGAAGALAAQTLRQSGFGGRLVIVDQENRVPYDRTVLSKYFLSGEQGAEKSPLQSQSFYRRHGIERLGGTVASIEPRSRTIRLRDGGLLPYHAVLLAAGAVPVRPDWPGLDQPHVFLLRSRADADAILAQAEQSQTAAVIGGSFIGMEVAASLRERGLDVTVIAKESAPFEKQLGKDVGGAFTRLHEQRGVGFRFNAKVSRITETAVVLETGEAVVADLVVIGLGVRPANVPVAGVAPVKGGGLMVDAGLRVTDSVFAAGDLAHFPLRGDGAPIRIEHWRVAQQQGRLAAQTMLGKDERYDAVPVFWTIQYLKRLDYVGHAKDWDRTVIHGDLTKPSFLAYYVKDGRVDAVAGFDRDQDMAAVVALFEHQKVWTPEALGDSPAAALRSIGGSLGQQGE